MAFRRDESDYDRYDKQDKEFKINDAIMKYGKKNMTKQESYLRRGEVKRYDKLLRKWVSNKD